MGLSVRGGKSCYRKLSNSLAPVQNGSLAAPLSSVSWVGTSLSAYRAEILAPGSSCLI